MTVQEAIRELHNIRPLGGIIPQKRAEAIDIAIECMEEVEQYRALGTVEELKEAREKQVAKKPEKLGKERSIENSYWIKCECGAISLADIKTHNQMYCSECGQLMTLDWSEEDD